VKLSKAVVAARELLQHHKIAQPPVPVEDLAKRLGVRLAFERMDSEISGMLIRDPERKVAVMAINSSHSSTRQRFTIAHELGHLLLHQGSPIFVDRTVRVNFRAPQASAGDHHQEIEANAFGAELLMPEELMLLAAQRNPGRADESMLDQLAERFRVSRQAMDYRLTNLGLLLPQ
jgi:Zn-dependent peptidase ImmA (M78 family)